jgi:predicted nucleic acid-binding protein
MNVYIDTNILVDFVCRREAFFEDARTLFAYGYSGVFSLQTSLPFMLKQQLVICHILS